MGRAQREGITSLSRIYLLNTLGTSTNSNLMNLETRNLITKRNTLVEAEGQRPYAHAYYTISPDGVETIAYQLGLTLDHEAKIYRGSELDKMLRLPLENKGQKTLF